MAGQVHLDKILSKCTPLIMAGQVHLDKILSKCTPLTMAAQVHLDKILSKCTPLFVSLILRFCLASTDDLAVALSWWLGRLVGFLRGWYRFRLALLR